MTATTTHSSISYDAPGGLADFTINFVFWDLADIVVYVRNSTTGVRTLQALTTDYTLSDGSGGAHVSGAVGELNFVSGKEPASGNEVHIIRESNLQQNVDFTQITKFPSASAEEGLDRAALRIQEAFNALQLRGMRMPQSDEDPTDVSGPDGTGWPNLELPDKAARGVTNAYLGFNTSGEPIILTVAITNVTAGAFGQTWAGLANSAAGRANLEAVYDKGGSEDCQIGTESARSAIAAAAFEGFFFTTDEHLMWYSDKSNWTQILFGQYTNALLPAAATAGRMYFDTDNLELLHDDGSAPLEAIHQPWTRGAIGGCKLSMGTTTRIDVAAGEVRAHLGNATVKGRNISIPSGFTKTLSTAGDWDPGTGNPGMAPGVGVATNTWFHVFLLANAAGTPDMAIDTDPAAANILSGAGDIFTAGYDKHIRRIGKFRTNATGSGQIPVFYQDGDVFMFDNPSLLGLDFAGAAGVNYTTATNLTLSTSDKNSNTIIRVALVNMTGASYLTELRQPDVSPQTITTPLGDSGSSGTGAWQQTIYTDATKRVRYRTVTDTSSRILIQQVGWADRREQDA